MVESKRYGFRLIKSMRMLQVLIWEAAIKR